MKIGVLSDTHDFLDPKIPRLFAGVDHIFHAGDIGSSLLLVELEQIAPVTSVGGNTDDPGFRYPDTAVTELDGRRFLLHHIVHPHAPLEPLRDRIVREHPDAVIFGHTHKPFCETMGGILYLNPGYTGKSRFGLPRSLAILHCTRSTLKAEFLTL